MENYSYGSGAGKMIPSEQSISNVPSKSTYKQLDSTNLPDPKEPADYSLYQHPGNINLVDQNGYVLEETPYYSHGEINTTPSMNLYHGADMYVVGASNSKDIMEKPNNTFNIPGTIPSKGAPNYDYINSALNINQGNYYNPYQVINDFVPGSESMKYEPKSGMDGEYVIPEISTKMNNSYVMNVNNSSNISGKIVQNSINGYIDPDSYTNLYEYGSGNYSEPIMNGIASMPDMKNMASATYPSGMGNVNYDLLMHNYNGDLYNNINSVSNAQNSASMGYLGGLDIPPLKVQPYGASFNSFNYDSMNYGGVNFEGTNFGEANLGNTHFRDSHIAGSHFGDVNFQPIPKDEFPLLFDKHKGADLLGEREGKYSKLIRSNNHAEGSHTHKHPPEQLQAILCLQRLEEIPTPFLNFKDIKYSVSVYFNSYDDILEKYQSQFYSCKLNESNTYADCDLKNEIIKLPFNNEEFIYLKVIETSMYKTEVTGRLQLKVKSLSQEYPLRIPIIGDDGNSKGFLIMNFFITSSFYDLKNDLLITDQSSLPSRPKSTRIRRKNNGFHFFENFTKWCCEITDHHMN
ncbi:conserved Plasmodium protein, unknown function [Plasmodium knowlesi strain H]|uniref:Uncharacterized protein n=3 Tax=Plasmodium knowlesi TaxID=5850 RepID=A0A5K1VD46_PLAKH|nr:uncharacterized protein PKNH_1416000 [Plasmodium knowlesi strain H]OTN63768.1 Uncharacterized protein PKNOH_S140233800 [Plasmodium knowlesi]CAA9990760.1 conserved protein, unknown function [Plasmodium knowlesi strain H]SBO21134.1 conserved Plasmodium protein, unknown function [Plasmodium knowlesi strain H]SBO21601.1 conserved Plasmodium protein, unknown function [Plasmodium knowlesi strain H]VVS80234.1 conserved protein, unknown function [Plasmodium knowlesi strain H]|eukprot:XP_002262049.1 [Plasmodium knowlesi strain H]